ncbi:MAG: toprim domain-containing protein, partial [Kofleriaceae bacterium]
SFVEVAEDLANRFGITVPRVEEAPELRRARGERMAMLELNKLATAFYREILADPKRGEPGRAYLVRRGVTNETADKFQLGYAPGEWSALVDQLRAKRADLELAVRIGLIAPRPSSGGYYDRIRDRLVCPVIVPGGEVVGFSSRLVAPAQKSPDGSEPPKYINSPESSVYKKGKLLFGLAQAREAMHAQKRTVIVEGNFDVITLHQAGFTEVVAPLGTALTIEQVNVLKRLTERIVLLYDGDRAGYKATMHALQLCVEADAEVQVAKRPGHGQSGGAGALQDGVDPDSLVAAGGAGQLREAIERAQGGIEFFAFEVWAKARGNSDARARALEDAVRLIAKIASPIKRDLIIGTLATGLEVDVGVVRNALARSGAAGPGSGPPGAPRPHGPPAHPNSPAPGTEEGAPATPKSVAPPPMDELEVIMLLADHPVLIATAEADKAFWLLTDERLRAMYSAARDGQSFLELAPAQLPPPTAKHVLSGKYASAKDPPSSLAAMTRNLEARKIDASRVELRKSLEDARRRGDHVLARNLAQQAVAQRTGNHELASRLEDERRAGSKTEKSASLVDPETSNRKQVE